MKPRAWAMLPLGLLLLGGGAGFLSQLEAHQRLGKPGIRVSPLPGTRRVSVPLPERVLDYTSTNLGPTAIEVQTLPADTTFARRFYTASDGFEAVLAVVMMGTDRTSIHKPEFCLENQGWHIIQRDTLALPVPRPHPYLLPVRRFITTQVRPDATGQAERLSTVFLFWFVADQRVTASHLTRILWMTWDLLRTGTLPRWAYVACSAVCAPGTEEATTQRLAAFLAAAVPTFQVASLPAQTAAAPPKATR